uniref:Uncharacterized protein n=1 Tax=Panagrolaimus sp. ES5 TaxID=591445 RepID=A0AC34FVY3_9BILA
MYMAAAQRLVNSPIFENQTPIFSGRQTSLYNYKNEYGVINEIIADYDYGSEFISFPIKYLNNGTIISNSSSDSSPLPFVSHSTNTSKCGFDNPQA